MVYAVLSDIHAHNWSLFSTVDPDGVNSRLRIILNEMERAADELLKAGGKVMVIAGDVFHVRGSVDPEVLNPVQQAIQRILDKGVTIHAIPGNHDLKGKETTELGSAIQTLAQTYSEKGSFSVFNEAGIYLTDAGRFGFVPWHSTNAALLADLQTLADSAPDVSEVDVFIHAGIDGVLPGMPDHGLSDQKLGAFGFRHVFAGHFHNHKIMRDGVVSIGATTHQTWGDVGSKAGFLLVADDGTVRFMDTHAPKFIDVSGRPEDEIQLLCDRNYVRFRGSQMAAEDIRELKTFFETHGALGTSIQAPKATVNARTGAANAPTANVTLDQSVAGYVDKAELPAHIDRNLVKAQCADILTKSRAVYEEA